MYEYVGAAGWQSSSLYDLAIWKNGLAFKNIDFSSLGRPVLKIAELKNGVSEQTARTMAQYDVSVFVRAGDMLFSWSGNPDTSIDVFRWEGEDGWLNQHIFKVTPKQGVSEDFLFFVLKWLRPRFAEIARNKQTTGLGHVTIQDLKRMMVGVPDQDEQNDIVRVLGPLQSKIDLNRRMNETLEAMARALFNDWFIDFGPTRAKMEGRAPYLTPEFWALFSDQLDNEAKPEGWQKTTLSEITIRITKGTTPTTGNIRSALSSDQQINFVKVNALTDDGQIIWEKLDQIPPSVHEGILRRSILQKDDVLYSIAGTIGRVALVEDELLPANTNQALAIIRANLERVSSQFLLMLLRQPVFKESLHANIVHAVQANLSLSMISNAPCVLPPSNLLTKMFAPIEIMIRKIQSNKRETRTLAAMRDLLLHKLMSGEIRVKDAEKEIEMVA